MTKHSENNPHLAVFLCPQTKTSTQPLLCQQNKFQWVQPELKCRTWTRTTASRPGISLTQTPTPAALWATMQGWKSKTALNHSNQQIITVTPASRLHSCVYWENRTKDCVFMYLPSSDSGEDVEVIVFVCLKFASEEVISRLRGVGSWTAGGFELGCYI